MSRYPRCPKTKFATTGDGAHVAYQVVGDGPIDILVARTLYFPIDSMWEEPRMVRFLDRLSTFSRHIWFDLRGTGASDRIVPEARLSESMVDDMVAVNRCEIELNHRRLQSKLNSDDV